MTVELTWNRILSASLAAVYVALGFLAGGPEAGCKMVLGVILPLACIWFSDAMGGYNGWVGSGSITSPSPGLIVCILGWVLLLLPVLIVIVGVIGS
jgi:hypothetical protein